MQITTSNYNMKSLYESILDIDNVVQQDMPILEDKYTIYNCPLEGGSYNRVVLTNFFDWRKMQAYCRKQNYKINPRFKLGQMQYGELVAICNHVQALGFEQNIVCDLKPFLKKNFDIMLTKKTTEKNCVFCTYTISSRKSEDPDAQMSFTLYMFENN